jgi:hypothetical protein
VSLRLSLAAGGATIAIAIAAGCGPRALVLPTGDGEAFPEYRAALDEAAAPCRAVRTLTAELAISGRVANQKLRGRATAGLAAPASLRLEGVAPFGPPAFILAADGNRATLLLPRDHRVIADAAPAALLEALVGLDLGPADLLAILSGCVVPGPRAAAGMSFGADWARIDLEGGVSAYLQRDRQRRWRIRAGVRPPMRIEYGEDAGQTPAAVRLLVTGGSGTTTDLRIDVSQVELNATLGPGVFTIEMPADARPMTLAELRQAGPLGDRR